MSSRAEKERAKQIQDKCQRVLTDMLKDDDNKYCVDCDAKGPRWASWNLGIFLCIRCAGIHRNLGVHISRVKSVNLDSWTPEQVVSLQQMGNSRARAVYEANLPDSFRRPQNDSGLEVFIRAKYEHKKYIAREWVAPPKIKVNWDKELDEELEKQKRKKRGAVQSSIRPINTLPVIPQPLPKPQSNNSPKPNRVVVQSSKTTTDLLGLDTPVKDSSSSNAIPESDMFENFFTARSDTSSSTTSAAPSNSSSLNLETTQEKSSTTSRSEEEANFFNQSLSTPTKQKPMTKDSILALYGKGTQNVMMPPGVLPGTNNAPTAFNMMPSTMQNPVQNINMFARPAATFNTTTPAFASQEFVNLNSTMGGNNAPAPMMNNISLSANPFYSLAASGMQSTTYPTQKQTGSNFQSIKSDFQQLNFAKQFDNLNLNGNVANGNNINMNNNTNTSNNSLNGGGNLFDFLNNGIGMPPTNHSNLSAGGTAGAGIAAAPLTAASAAAGTTSNNFNFGQMASNNLWQ